jgi:hypothetical protein
VTIKESILLVNTGHLNPSNSHFGPPVRGEWAMDPAATDPEQVLAVES